MTSSNSDTRLDGVIQFLRDFAVADLDEGAADAVTVGMVYQQEAERVWLPRLEAIALAAKTLRTEALLHLNNSIGCALDHYGVDPAEQGLPQWIADSQQRIKEACDALGATPPPSVSGEKES